MSVYFMLMESEPEPMVKIGKTNNIKARLQTISTSTPFNVKLLAILEDIEEKELHNKFNHLKINKEWFKYSEEIESFIKPFRVDVEKDDFDKDKEIIRLKKEIFDWEILSEELINVSKRDHLYFNMTNRMVMAFEEWLKNNGFDPEKILDEYFNNLSPEEARNDVEFLLSKERK